MKKTLKRNLILILSILTLIVSSCGFNEKEEIDIKQKIKEEIKLSIAEKEGQINNKRNKEELNNNDTEEKQINEDVNESEINEENEENKKENIKEDKIIETKENENTEPLPQAIFEEYENEQNEKEELNLTTEEFEGENTKNTFSKTDYKVFSKIQDSLNYLRGKNCLITIKADPGNTLYLLLNNNNESIEISQLGMTECITIYRNDGITLNFTESLTTNYDRDLFSLIDNSLLMLEDKQAKASIVKKDNLEVLNIEVKGKKRVIDLLKKTYKENSKEMIYYLFNPKEINEQEMCLNIYMEFNENGKLYGGGVDIYDNNEKHRNWWYFNNYQTHNAWNLSKEWYKNEFNDVDAWYDLLEVLKQEIGF